MLFFLSMQSEFSCTPDIKLFYIFNRDFNPSILSISQLCYDYNALDWHFVIIDGTAEKHICSYTPLVPIGHSK